jgi:hypothetical protein
MQHSVEADCAFSQLSRPYSKCLSRRPRLSEQSLQISFDGALTRIQHFRAIGGAFSDSWSGQSWFFVCLLVARLSLN